MSGKSDKLESSLPAYYRLNLPEQIKPSLPLLYVGSPPRLRLVLELVGYIAVQDVSSPLIKVLDTLKAFSALFFACEFIAKMESEGDITLALALENSEGQTLPSYHEAWRFALKYANYDLIDFNLADSVGRKVYSIIDMFHGMLEEHYSNYSEMPKCASSEPDFVNKLRYPTISNVLGFLKENSAVPEVEAALPILYILLRRIDEAIAVYENKSEMEPYDHYNLGTIYLIEEGNFPMERNQLEEAYELAVKQQRKSRKLAAAYYSLVRLAYYNLGMTYLIEKDWEKAAEYFKPLAEWILRNKYSPNMRFVDYVIAQCSCNNLGICHYYGNDNTRDALNCFEAAAYCKEFTLFSHGESNRRYLIDRLLGIPLGQREERQEFRDIIWKCEAMQEVIDKIRKAACSDSNVLITGETGTGKELVARAIHEESERSSNPFIAFNCSTTAETMADSVLFGHERGAFTGADRRKKGIFEEADGGTLFLDQLESMGLGVQAKILRAIQFGEIGRVGSEAKLIDVDVGILSATNKSLEELVESGKFREDLYYRMNVIEIYIPPLRERKEDVPLLLDHFISKYSTDSKRIRWISQDARILLTNYDWPGNVRELENAIESAAAMSEGGIIRLCDIPKRIQDALKDDEDTERKIILCALQENDGNVSEVARQLEWDRSKLRRKIGEYGIDPKAFERVR